MCSECTTHTAREVQRTAGLKRPPLIRKNTQAFAVRENPNDKLIYSNCDGFFCTTVVVTCVPTLVFDEMLATCVPAKAKKRKEMVPTNSPMTATVWPLMLLGILWIKAEADEAVVAFGLLVFISKDFSICGVRT